MFDLDALIAFKDLLVAVFPRRRQGGFLIFFRRRVFVFVLLCLGYEGFLKGVVGVVEVIAATAIIFIIVFWRVAIS